MSQSACDGGFMAEPPQEIFISRELAGDHFDCTHLVEQPVPGAVDNRHSSRPNPSQNDVLATDDHPRFKLSGNAQSLVISGADLKLVRKEVLACSAVFHLPLRPALGYVSLETDFTDVLARCFAGHHTSELIGN